MSTPYPVPGHQGGNLTSEKVRTHSTRTPNDQTGLTIRVSGGAGTGLTRLAAFDAALRSAGVADFNLVRLSSVIPADADVVEVSGGNQIGGGHGDLLYCVYADAYSSTPGEQAWAGLAWGTCYAGGPGVFVEHTGNSRSVVARDLEVSLRSMAETRSWFFPEPGVTLASAQCRDHPVCAVVVATYQRRSWIADDA